MKTRTNNSSLLCPYGWILCSVFQLVTVLLDPAGKGNGILGFGFVRYSLLRRQRLWTGHSCSL